MAIRFHGLPTTLFPPELQPEIARFNRDMREIFALEGVLNSPVSPRRSDLTIARTGSEQVQADRIINLTTVVGSTGGGSGSTHAILSTTHQDAVTASAVKGDLLYANATPEWDRLPVGATSSKQLLESQSTGLPAWSTITYEKGICVESPTGAEDLTIWHLPENVEVTEVRGVLQGGSVTGVSFDVKWAADRSAAGTSLLHVVANLTGNTTGQVFTLGSTISNIQPTANAYVWLETSAGGGTGTMHVSCKFKRIP